MHYVALLRGIGPGNPNMRNDKLRSVLENLGLRNVRSVISSGNVLFESSAAPSALESRIEAAWPSELGFESTTIVRSQADLQKLVHAKPFGRAEHSRQTYLNVTFLKKASRKPLSIVELKRFGVTKRFDREICSVINTAVETSPNLMLWLEKEFGKAITTRTYKTVERILTKMNT